MEGRDEEEERRRLTPLRDHGLRECVGHCDFQFAEDGAGYEGVFFGVPADHFCVGLLSLWVERGRMEWWGKKVWDRKGQKRRVVV